jgi:hypothetical protein
MKRNIKDMNHEELKAYNNEKKRRQRDRENSERVVDFDDYEMPDTHQKQLSDHTNSVVNQIQSETEPTDRDRWIIDMVTRVLFGLENNMTKKVVDPSGMLIGGVFPDAAWVETIHHVHRFPGILKSTTFADLYQKFLADMLKWNRTHGAYTSPEFVGILEQEVAGTYSLPGVPEPHQPPLPVAVPETTPSDREIRNQGAIQLLNLGIPQDARRYLETGE